MCWLLATELGPLSSAFSAMAQPGSQPALPTKRRWRQGWALTGLQYSWVQSGSESPGPQVNEAVLEARLGSHWAAVTPFCFHHCESPTPQVNEAVLEAGEVDASPPLELKDALVYAPSPSGAIEPSWIASVFCTGCYSCSQSWRGAAHDIT